MNKNKSITAKILSVITMCILLCSILLSCKEKDNSLAPYQGKSQMSQLLVEEGSFVPKITWVGGYVSAIGVNKGSIASLDSSLIWLIIMDEDNIRFPVKFGELPQNATDMTELYGGTKLDTLLEDQQYTFWVMKNDLWEHVSDLNGKVFNIDSTLQETEYDIIADTAKINLWSHTQSTQSLDVFINIADVVARGRLADIFIEQPTTSNNPLVSWQIKQDGVSDSLVALCGINFGQQFNINEIIWEVWSVIQIDSVNQYGTQNVISSPFKIGQTFDNTRTFAELPAEGLERDKSYYLWIANKDWDGENRTRFANYYAYISFTTW